MTIPAGERVTNGQASVPAHALLPGPGGNIAAFEMIGPCCAAYLLAANTTAFTGGADERHYQAVAQRDIDQTAKTLQTSFQASVDAIFEALLQPSETMLTPACEPSISTDRQVGQEATSITVTLELHCRAFAYNTASLHQAIGQRVDQQATRQLGSTYQRRGEIRHDVLWSQAQESTVVLQIKATGSYTYQFSQEQLEQLKRGIAGKGKGDAGAWLEPQSGFQHITLALEEGERLPTAPHRINLVILLEGPEHSSTQQYEYNRFFK